MGVVVNISNITDKLKRTPNNIIIFTISALASYVIQEFMGEYVKRDQMSIATDSC